MNGKKVHTDRKHTVPCELFLSYDTGDDVESSKNESLDSEIKSKPSSLVRLMQKLSIKEPENQYNEYVFSEYYINNTN
jgi:hypothetical protein